MDDSLCFKLFLNHFTHFMNALEQICHFFPSKVSEPWYYSLWDDQNVYPQRPRSQHESKWGSITREGRDEKGESLRPGTRGFRFTIPRDRGDW